MIGYTESPRAWWLTRGMARVTGVSLSRAVVDGWLSRAELAEMVLRCEACAMDECCTRWLAQSASARRMPVFCPNKAAIEALAPH